jgi:pseudouridine synthase
MELVLPGLEARYGRGNPSVEGLHPVGRLDRDSEGLLLLSNDGAFTHALTHPRHGVSKTYVAEISGQPSPQALAQLRSGVEIEGRTTAPAQARLLPGTTNRGAHRIEVTLREGRKRQVRRMLTVVGHPVRRLVRTAVGSLKLGTLKPGQYRELSSAEVLSLLAAGETEAEGPAAPPAGGQPVRKARSPRPRAARTSPGSEAAPGTAGRRRRS